MNSREKKKARARRLKTRARVEIAERRVGKVDHAALASSGHMSGRIDAFGTAPFELLSKAKQRAPSNFFLLEMALRKYPMVVPHLFAYADCSSTDSEFKYARNFSMTETIPMGKHKVNTLGLIT